MNLSTLATLGTEKNDHCRKAETRVNVWTVRRNKNCHCREVAVSGDSTVVDNRKERPYLVLWSAFCSDTLWLQRPKLILFFPICWCEVYSVLLIWIKHSLLFRNTVEPPLTTTSTQRPSTATRLQWPFFFSWRTVHTLTLVLTFLQWPLSSVPKVERLNCT